MDDMKDSPEVAAAMDEAEYQSALAVVRKRGERNSRGFEEAYRELCKRYGVQWAPFIHGQNVAGLIEMRQVPYAER